MLLLTFVAIDFCRCCRKKGKNDRQGATPGEKEELLSKDQIYLSTDEPEFQKCCLNYVSDNIPTKVRDFTAPYSKISNTLNNLKDWDEFYEDINKEKQSQSDKLNVKTVINYIAMANSAKRVMNRAALVSSYTDLLYFIEIIFPNVPSSKRASVAEILYDEMDHETWFIECGVLVSQILAPALIILPIAIFVLAWTGFETYYYMDLPRQLYEKLPSYTMLSFGFSLPVVNKEWTGYIRASLPLVIVFFIIMLFYDKFIV